MPEQKQTSAFTWAFGLTLVATTVGYGTDRACADSSTPVVAQATKSETKEKASKPADKKAANRAANKGGGKSGSAGAGNKSSAIGEVTPEREAAVLAFIDEHHPDLAVLFARLKEMNRTEYERAMRDIDRARERLAQTRARDERRYEIELRQWQNQSRIDLLVARLKLADNDEHREQLRTLLSERADLKQAALRFERERLAERLQKIDQQLESLAATRDSQIDHQLRQFLAPNRPGARPRDKKEKSEPSKASK